MFFDGVSEYFREHSQHDVTISAALFRTMEYMEKSISSSDVAIRTIFAAVVGATVGMAVTILARLLI